MVFDGEIAGSVVSLRAVEPQDCGERYLAWMTDEETNRYMETRWTRQTPESILGFVESIRASDHSWLFAIVHEGAHVGNIKIGPVDSRYRNADNSYFVGEKSVRGRGVASEAIRLVVDFGFGTLGLHRIQAGAFRENVASQKALERCGFRLEGVFRQKYYLSKESEWTDCLEYAMLYDEWKESRK